MSSWKTITLGAAVLFGTVALGHAQRQSAPVDTKAVLDVEHVRMSPGVLDKTDNVNVYGDPDKPGLYITRHRWRAGKTSRPHFHDKDRIVTVIQGTWWTDEGDVYQPDKMVPIKAGGSMYHPAGFHHYDGAKGEDAIVEIIGIGPVSTTQTEKK